MMSDFRGLYIHVPFCVRKCPYCDFYSTAGRGDLLENYAAAVVRNLREYPEQFDTVYFGGGTPNLIAEYMPGILQAVSTIPGAEISAECNPASASPETLRIMRRAGVNRISVGVQSLQDNELKKLGRLHNAKQAEELIVQARQAGFDSISADVMLGVPGADGGFPDGHAGAAREAPDTAHFGVHADAGTSYAVRKIAACGYGGRRYNGGPLRAVPAALRGARLPSIRDIEFLPGGLRVPTQSEILA